MSETFEEFIDQESKYLEWIASHPNGYVLNSYRKPRPYYMPLHTARCPTVTEYRQHKGTDAFTGGSNIKVCADDPSGLLGWMARHGATHFTSLCSTCEPDISQLDQVKVEEARLQREAQQLMVEPSKLQQELINVSKAPPDYYYAQTKVFKRNAAVVAAALLRAKGVCEACNSTAPFLRASNNEPYLEVHHKIPLANGGIDHPDNAIALCPNCHRKAHFG